MVKNRKLTLTIFCLLFLSSCATTKPFRDTNGNIIKGSIAALETIKINGIKIQLLIRGENVTNPVILFLHGGPGAPEMALTNYYYQKKLEKDFILVHYDQRGAGKSFSKDIPPETMTINHIVEDTRDVSKYLLKRFGKDKIILMGHSWGTIIGVYCINKYPKLYDYYIGIGQVVNMHENELLSYNYTLDRAKQTNNRIAVGQLEKIGIPPYRSLKDGNIQRKWLMKLGGSIYNGNSFSDVKEGRKTNKEYTLVDWIFYWLPGLKYSNKMLQGELNNVNLFESVKSFDVPIYLLLGRHDYQAPSEIAEKYFNLIKAPNKKLYCFEQSAHMIHFEEPEEFIKTIKEISTYTSFYK